MNARAHLENLLESSTAQVWNKRLIDDALTLDDLDGWMDPDGKLHTSEESNHDTWAADWLNRFHGRTNIQDAVGEMYALGWVRVVGEWSEHARVLYVSHGVKQPNKLQLAQMEMLAIELNAQLISDGPAGGQTLYTPPE